MHAVGDLVLVFRGRHVCPRLTDVRLERNARLVLALGYEVGLLGMELGLDGGGE